MQIISFALTTDALLACQKTVTRRDWPDKYAAQFQVGNLVQAYDKSPRNGGRCVAIIRIEAKHREPLARLIESPEYGQTELIKEGNLWTRMEDFLAIFGNLRYGDPIRLQFAMVELKGEQASLSFQDPVLSVHAEFCQITGQKLKLSLCQPFWKDLMHTHGFMPQDVALTARYLLRQVKAQKRLDGCLKIFNFANPVQFDADLALAKKAQPTKLPIRPAMIQPVEPDQPASDQQREQIAAGLADLQKKLRGRQTGG